MKAVAAGVALLTLLALPGLAQADYGVGSALEANAPVLLSGRVDALVSRGVAGFVSTAADDSLRLDLAAEEIAYTYRDVQLPTCSGTQAFTCAATGTPDKSIDEESGTLRDARVTLVRALGASKLLVTNDDQYGDTPTFVDGGKLVASSTGSMLLGANAKELHISPYDADWSQGDPEALTDPVYTAPALTGQLATQGGSLAATGGFEALLQGFSIRLQGTDAETGEPVDVTYETPDPEGGAQWRFLVLEAAEGALRATSAAPLAAYGVGSVDIRPGGSATLQAAEGTLVQDGRPRDYTGEDVTLAAPLNLALTKTPTAGDPIRLTLALSSVLRIAEGLPPEQDEPTDTSALVAAGAAGASGAGLLAALLFFWPRLKFGATALFLPLYSRIERQSVLDHEKRDEIYELIRATPGIHAHEIGEKVQIGWGTTVYHLKLLETHSLIVSKKSGRYKRFFVNTGEYTKKKDVYGALRNDTAKAVAQFIVDHPGTSQKDLCAALSIQPSLASWHVEKLEGVGLVKRVKDGRQVRYFAGPAWSDLNVRIDPLGGASGVAET